MIALDASALLAWLFRERGGDEVADRIEEGCLSTVNLSEVLARFARDGHDPQAVAARLAATGMEITDFTPHQASLAAALAPKTVRLGLCLGDRACLALALDRGIPALTADRDWKKLHLDIPVIVVR